MVVPASSGESSTSRRPSRRNAGGGSYTTYTHGTKTVRLEEDVYERIRAKKRDDETFSEAIDRLTSDYTLLDFAGGMSDREAEEVRNRIDEANEAYADDLAEKFDG